MSATRRLRGELHEMADGIDKTIALMPAKSTGDPSDLFHLRGIIMAPEGSPIENYILFVDILIPEEYPFRPPKGIKFENKVWHPRVDIQTGAVCMGITSPEDWREKYRLETCLASLQTSLADPESYPSVYDQLKNQKACNQYFTDRRAYNQEARRWAEQSNEGYGKVTFYDYRVTAIQSILSMPETTMKYKCSIFCQRKSNFVWKLMLFVIPNVAIYQQHATTYFGKLCMQKLTSFDFDFNVKAVTVDIPSNGYMSKDKCWKITPICTKIMKESCDANPRKNSLPFCELEFEWVHPDIKPQRLIEKITLNNLNSEIMYKVDVCIDPSSGDPGPVDDSTLNIHSCFQKLLPLAANWENVGCLLNIPNSVLKQIRHNEERAQDRLREMLNTWLENTKSPHTWEALAKAVEPFDQGMAEELKKV